MPPELPAQPIPETDLKKEKFSDKFRSFIISALLTFFGATLILVIIFRFFDPNITTFMIYRYITGDKEEQAIRTEWKEYRDISRSIKRAIIASEDQNFFHHSGFDLHAIKKALTYNFKKKHRKIHGASTISQQVAKNLFLFPNRTWIRKGLEVYFTCLIEIFWSKQRILEVYLNIIELGKGVYGIEKASKINFKKSSKNLTREEAALFAAIIPNPRKYSVKKITPFLQKRKRWILNQMNKVEME